jgi:selenocysteine lyase/cysteine desulfurase
MRDMGTHAALPSLDDMLQSSLLIEEGEHEFASEDEDVQELRHLFFPVTRHCIYFNHASRGPLPRPVTRTVQEYIEDAADFGGVHEDRWQEYRNGAHRRLASFIHARSNQVALTPSTGDGLMLIAAGLDWKEGETILIAEGEFPSNVYVWKNLEELGVKVRFVPARDHRIPIEDVLAAIDEHTRLVSLSLVEFATGFRHDIKAITERCHERGIVCGIDAMQALGVLAVDVQQLAVDFLAAASHKWLLAPHTSGMLYVSDALLEQLKPRRRGWFSVENPYDFFNYRQQLKTGAARFEHSIPGSVAAVGLDAALGLFETIDGGMEVIEQRILGLTDAAIAGLRNLGYPVISSQREGERSGIVCFQPHPERQDLAAEQIVNELALQNIHVSARGGSVRLSPHFYNEQAEIDALLNALEEMKRPPVSEK